jgi:hypothetical protein
MWHVSHRGYVHTSFMGKPDEKSHLEDLAADGRTIMDL